MTPFISQGGKTYKLRIYRTDGSYVVRSTGTRDKASAKAMQRAHDAIRDKPRYRCILDAVASRTLTMEAAWLAYENGTLDGILAQLSDVNIEPYITGWQNGTAKRSTQDTANHYASAVRSLIPAGTSFMRSQLTTDRLIQWIETMTVTPSTIRKRGMGMRQFCAYLVTRRILAENPMEAVPLPSQGKPRCHFLETPEAIRLANEQPSPYREYAAVLAGTGIEVSAALAIRRRDVDVAHREIHAPGTKTATRNRKVRVAEWAWPYVLTAIDGLLPDARLFAGVVDRWIQRDVHIAACRALQDEFPIYRGYTPRDHRHTYAVRAVRAGTPLKVVATQLGHVNEQMVVKVYGNFTPTQDDRDRWERIAAAQDEENARVVQG